MTPSPAFWDPPAEDGIALVDAAGGDAWTYARLAESVARTAQRLAGRGLAGRGLAFLFVDNRPAAVVAYLAALQAGVPAALLNPALHPSLAERLLATYRPEWIFWPAGARSVALPGYAEADGLGDWLYARQPLAAPAHPELALLLTTSGSTGSPKFVRLSRANLASNAAAIAAYLGLTSVERPITSLPLYYSYGLSVVNSHLAVGATLVLTNAGLMEKEFWQAVRGHGCTSLAGVPYMYELLQRLRLTRMELPRLRTLTQAGGRLRRELKAPLAEWAAATGRRFFVMYGQTEATARIAYVPPERLAENLDAVGTAIPGGRLRLFAGDDEIVESGREGELVYEGPNVMLGYATGRGCLAKGDELGGRLHTGDLGYRNAAGMFCVGGRLSRFVKVFGHRISLDEAEELIEGRLGVPTICLGREDLLHVVCQSADAGDRRQAMADEVCELLGIHPQAVDLRLVAALPRTDAAKKDYRRMAELVATP